MRQFIYLILFIALASFSVFHCTYNGVDCYVFNDFYRVPIRVLKNMDANNPREVECLLKLDPSVWGSLSWRACSHIPVQILRDLVERMPNFKSLIFQDRICNATTMTKNSAELMNISSSLPSNVAVNASYSKGYHTSESQPTQAQSVMLSWPCEQVEESVRSVWISCGLCAPDESWLRYFRWLYRLRIFVQAKFIDMVVVLCFISYETEMIFGLSDACEDLFRSGLRRVWHWLMYYVMVAYKIFKDFYDKTGIIAINTIVAETIKEQDPEAANQLKHIANEVQELGEGTESVSSALGRGASNLDSLEKTQSALAQANRVDLERKSAGFISQLVAGVKLLHRLIKFSIHGSPTAEYRKETRLEAAFNQDAL